MKIVSSVGIAIYDYVFATKNLQLNICTCAGGRREAPMCVFVFVKEHVRRTVWLWQTSYIRYQLVTLMYTDHDNFACPFYFILTTLSHTTWHCIKQNNTPSLDHYPRHNFLFMIYNFSRSTNCSKLMSYAPYITKLVFTRTIFCHSNKHEHTK